MSFFRPPVAASSIALIAALSLVPLAGQARDGRRIGEDVVQEIAPLSREASREIIFEMPPMQSVKKSAAAPKLTPDVARAVESAKPVGPVKIVAPPKLAEPAKPVEPPKTADPDQETVAAAPTDAETPEPAMAEPSAVTPQPVAEAESAAAGSARIDEQATAGGAPAAEAQPAVEATQSLQETRTSGGAEQPGAAAVPPLALMTQHPPRKSLSALPEPIAKLDRQALGPHMPPAANPAWPATKSFAQASAEPNTDVDAVPDKETQTPASGETLAIEQQVAEAAPSVATDDPAAVAAETPPPADQAREQAAAEARVAALFAQGIKGPAEIRIADRATMWLPAGRVYLPIEPSRKIAREAGLDLRAGAQGLIAPGVDRLDWLATVELLEDGYIKADDADAMQPEKLLAAFEASLPDVNAQRAAVGQPPVTLGGWLTPPTLDAKHRLSACVSVATQSGENGFDRYFNCESWALGRHGAIKVTLAEGGEHADRLKGEAASLIETIVYDRGKTYEEIEVAVDRVASYVAADLLTRDVSAKAIAPIAPVEQGESRLLLALLLVAKLWKVILFALAAIGGVIAWMKRKKTVAGELPAPAATAIVETSETAGKIKVAAAEGKPSLFARLLPTLHARFAAKHDQSTAVMKVEVKVADVVDLPKAETNKKDAAGGGLFAKLARLRSAVKKDGAKAAPAVAAREIEDKTAATTKGADEPVSALKKLATRMRRSSPEPEAPPVDVSRAIRGARNLPGAAPVDPEAIEPAANIVQPNVASASQSAPVEPTGEDDPFGLVEPGDAAATSAAINAGRALRAAGG